MNPQTEKRKEWTCVFYKVSSSCSTCGTRRITLATNIYEIQINIICFFIFIFISISYLHIQCRQNNHGRSAIELGFHHQHDKCGWCWCMKSLKITKRLSEAVIRRSTYNTMDRWKRTNNDLQNIAQKTKDRATQTPLKSGCEFMFSRMVSSSASPLHIVYGLFFIDVVASASCFPIISYVSSSL
jgi:hypothetical protein